MASKAAESRLPWWNAEGQEWPDKIIVMRHASHTNGVIGTAGRQQIRDVARSLAEWCLLTEVNIEGFEPYTTHDHLGHEVAATARLMDQHLLAARAGLRKVNVKRTTELHPALTPAYAPVEDSGLRAIVLNEPQAGELVNALSGLSIELQRGELVYLEAADHSVSVFGRSFCYRAPFRARWTMAPHEPGGDAALNEIREKVASKMKTAGVLGGLITTLLTFVLSRLFDGGIRWGVPAFAALIAFGVSAILFFVTMFFYDSLTMPSRFWGQHASRSRWKKAKGKSSKPENSSSVSDDSPPAPDGSPPASEDSLPSRDWAASSPGWLLARPPSGTIRVLHMNMVRVWTWVFVPAILALGVGVGSLLLALDAPAVSTAPTATPQSSKVVAQSTSETPKTSVDASTSAAPSTSVVARWTTGEDENDPARDNVVDLGAGHAIALLIAGAATLAWSLTFRPRLGASD